MKQIIAFIFFLTIGLTSFSQKILTLEGALDYAKQNSPEMRQSEITLSNSRQNLIAQRATLKPQLSLDVSPVSYSRSQRLDNRSGEVYVNESTTSSGVFTLNQKILPTGGTIFMKNNTSFQNNYTSSSQSVEPYTKTLQNNLSINFSQPIFTYNRTKVDLQKMILAYEDAYLRYNLQQLSIEKSVTQLFYNLYAKQMGLLIAKDELKNNQENYEIVKNKVEGGLMALEELYQQEVNLATSKSNVFNQQVSLDNAKDEFKIKIGYPIDNEFDILAKVGADTINNIDIKMATDLALKNRMEIRQRNISIENSMFNLIQAKTTNEFAGVITAGIGLQNLSQYYTDKKTDVNPTLSTPSVGLTLSVPIFDFGERKAKIKSAEGSLQSSQLDLESEKLDIILNIRESNRNLKNLQNQIEIQNINVKNAQLTYDINMERYKNGDLTSMNLGLFQTQLSSKKLALTNAMINYKLELLNLKIQALYDFETNVSIVPVSFSINK
jgi:outer membrane protein